ncbi:MAG: hypothetical protein PHW73_09425 [Atribacterota bacterium]|nr:hypothetical protein [Atribacterota bacterium]
MPLPGGFVEEQAVLPIGFQPEMNTLPSGFVQEDSVIPEIKQAPPTGVFDKMISFFKDPEREVAKAQNIYALSDVTGLPLQEVNKNYEVLRRSVKVTGINPDLDRKEYMGMVMLPLVATGFVTNPIGTAAGLVVFGALDKAIPTDKFNNYLRDRGISEDITAVVDMADFIGKSMIVGGVFKKAPGLAEGFFKRKITEYKMPKTINLMAEQVRDIFQTGKLTTPEQQSLLGSLNLNSYDMRAALKHGVNINIPAEKIITLTDKPYWAKVKGMFGIKPTSEKMSLKAGEPTKAPAGLLENKAQAGNEQVVTGNPVKKVIDALKGAKSVRGEQETIYAKARSQKFAKMQAVGEKVRGEKGFYAQLGALKGELPRAEFETIRNKLTQEDIDSLFNMVKDSNQIGEWDKLSAREGLAKLFGEYGGKVPTENELAMLNKVFGEDFTKTILSKRTFFEQAKFIGTQIANIPRSLMASIDLSAPMRQGVFLIGRPKQFFPSFKKMFGAFKSEESYKAIQDAIVTHPDFQLARDSNLSLTDMDVMLGQREEAFMSNWAEKIPLVGRGVRASGRAYVGFLNKLRFDVFADLVNKAEGLGLDPRKNRDLTKSIADFINNATGRGTLPNGLQKSAIALNNIFFSPRLIMSRLNLLNPQFYVKQKPFVRKEALKSLFSFIGFGLGAITLAKMAGAEVSNDSRSSDFMKIKIGNTRIDPWGGFQQLAVIASRIVSGKYISSTTGKEMTLGEGYKPMTRADIIQRFFESKLAPIPSFIVALAKGQNAIGEKINVPLEVVQRFIPMVLQDMYDLAKDSPGLLPASVLGVFGMGLQTYEEKSRF